MQPLPAVLQICSPAVMQPGPSSIQLTSSPGQHDIASVCLQAKSGAASTAHFLSAPKSSPQPSPSRPQPLATSIATLQPDMAQPLPGSTLQASASLVLQRASLGSLGTLEISIGSPASPHACCQAPLPSQPPPAGGTAGVLAHAALGSGEVYSSPLRLLAGSAAEQSMRDVDEAASAEQLGKQGLEPQPMGSKGSTDSQPQDSDEQLAEVHDPSGAAVPVSPWLTQPAAYAGSQDAEAAARAAKRAEAEEEAVRLAVQASLQVAADSSRALPSADGDAKQAEAEENAVQQAVQASMGAAQGGVRDPSEATIPGLERRVCNQAARLWERTASPPQQGAESPSQQQQQQPHQPAEEGIANAATQPHFTSPESLEVVCPDSGRADSPAELATRASAAGNSKLAAVPSAPGRQGAGQEQHATSAGPPPDSRKPASCHDMNTSRSPARATMVATGNKTAAPEEEPVPLRPSAAEQLAVYCEFRRKKVPCKAPLWLQ